MNAARISIQTEAIIAVFPHLPLPLLSSQELSHPQFVRLYVVVSLSRRSKNSNIITNCWICFNLSYWSSIRVIVPREILVIVAAKEIEAQGQEKQEKSWRQKT